MKKTTVEVDITDIVFAVESGLPITIMGVEYVPASTVKKEANVIGKMVEYLWDNFDDEGELEREDYIPDARKLLNIVADDLEEFIGTLSDATPQHENAALILHHLRRYGT